MNAVGAGALVATLLAALASGASGMIVGCSASGTSGGGSDVDASSSDGSSGDSSVAHDSSAADSAADAGASDSAVDSAPDGPACVVQNPTGAAACDTCITQFCCDSDNICFNDTGCLDIFVCSGNCVDAGDAGGCINACEAQDPGSAPAFNTFVQCLAAHCQVACGS
jgi:hypothetical protein